MYMQALMHHTDSSKGAYRQPRTHLQVSSANSGQQANFSCTEPVTAVQHHLFGLDVGPNCSHVVARAPRSLGARPAKFSAGLRVDQPGKL